MSMRLRRMRATLVSSMINQRLRFENYKNLAQTGRDVEGLKHTTFGGKNAVGRGTIFANEVTVGYATTIGPNCIVHGPVRLGNYSQLGPSVGIYGQDHPITYATTYLNQHLFEGRLKENVSQKQVVIGHDVWVGHGAIILKGVEIGNGAVIGAGSVVTHSVPDYAIAFGNPACVRRYRFSENIIALLQKIQWWLLCTEELDRLEEMFHVDFAQCPEEGIRLLKDLLNSREVNSVNKEHEMFRE